MQKKIPLIAIANYGPHITLQQTIDGLKEKLNDLGYIENKNIHYEIMDVNFDTAMINQMIIKLKSSKPDVIIAISTPVAQSAKNMVKDIPIVFVDITDPIESGLGNQTGSNSNITGASDKQDLFLMLDLAKKVIPNARKVGLLYSTGENNDLSLVKELKVAAKKYNMEVVDVPVEHARDTATRMNLFKDKVDFIYTGSSAVVQTAFSSIIQKAESMNLPIINFDHSEVINNNVLASFGVAFNQIGANAALITHSLLNGESANNIEIIYPGRNDHIGYLSKKRAEKLGLIIPSDLVNIIIIE